MRASKRCDDDGDDEETSLPKRCSKACGGDERQSGPQHATVISLRMHKGPPRCRASAAGPRGQCNGLTVKRITKEEGGMKDENHDM